jgi:hypothetical protein
MPRFTLFFIASVMFSNVIFGKHLNSIDSSDIQTLNMFIGHWKGNLKIVNMGEVLHIIPCDLNIKPDSANQESLIWSMSFHGEQGTIEKPYKLLSSEESGKFLLDEGNSIIIPEYFSENSLSNFYKVEENFYFVETTLLNANEIRFRISVISGQPELISGASNDSNEIPQVESHRIYTVQEAFLKKQ